MFRYALLAGGVVLAALAIIHPAPRPLASAPAAPAFHERPRSTTEATIVIYVAGAVRNPGLYHLRSGSRADDAVRLAGGFAQHADTAGVNLAEQLGDGDEVDVPVLGDAPHRAARRSRRRARSRRRHVAPVSLNSADARSLAAVPGIGASIAQRIVELRESEGAFDSLDQLLDVAGMSSGRLERARPYLRL